MATNPRIQDQIRVTFVAYEKEKLSSKLKYNILKLITILKLIWQVKRLLARQIALNRLNKRLSIELLSFERSVLDIIATSLRCGFKFKEKMRYTLQLKFARGAFNSIC